MAIDMNNLLTLPPAERRKIAERLWKSLAPVNSDTVVRETRTMD